MAKVSDYGAACSIFSTCLNFSIINSFLKSQSRKGFISGRVNSMESQREEEAGLRRSVGSRLWESPKWGSPPPSHGLGTLTRGLRQLWRITCSPLTPLRTPPPPKHQKPLGEWRGVGDSDKGTRTHSLEQTGSALSWRRGYRGRAIAVSIWVRLDFLRFAKGSHR